jgi:hypothetical protein
MAESPYKHLKDKYTELVSSLSDPEITKEPDFNSQLDNYRRMLTQIVEQQ